MEVGKLRTNSATHIFYFIVDAATPATPNATRLKHYFVSTTLDSYVEAYYFLVRTLTEASSPSSSSAAAAAAVASAKKQAYREWHQVYTRVFGTIDYDAFVKNVESLKTNYFNLDTTEQMARRRVEEMEAASRLGPRPGALIPTPPPPIASAADAGSSLALVSSRFSGGGGGGALVVGGSSSNEAEAAVELHRLRAELSEVSGKLRVEKNRQQIATLAEAELAAMRYKYEQAMKDAESERLKAADAEQMLRTQVRQMQERIDRLVTQQEAAVAEMSNADRQRATAIEETFLKREVAMQKEFEAALAERDRKLSRAASKIEAMEGQITRLSDQLIESQGDVTKLTLMVQNANIHLQALDETARKQKVLLEERDRQIDEEQKALQRSKALEQRLESELVGLRTELSRWQAEAQRYARFTASLQGNLRTLDDTSATASAIVRRRLTDALNMQQQIGVTNRNQYAYNL